MIFTVSICLIRCYLDIDKVSEYRNPYYSISEEIPISQQAWSYKVTKVSGVEISACGCEGLVLFVSTDISSRFSKIDRVSI